MSQCLSTSGRWIANQIASAGTANASMSARRPRRITHTRTASTTAIGMVAVAAATPSTSPDSMVRRRANSSSPTAHSAIGNRSHDTRPAMRTTGAAATSMASHERRAPLRDSAPMKTAEMTHAMKHR